jgi:hypothetical protein
VIASGTIAYSARGIDRRKDAVDAAVRGHRADAATHAAWSVTLRTGSPISLTGILATSDGAALRSQPACRRSSPRPAHPARRRRESRRHHVPHGCRM